MGKDFRFKVHDDSDRAEVFMKVFGRLEVCVTNIVPEVANLPGFDEPQRVYKLDLNEITFDEQKALINHISDKFNLNPTLVDKQIAERGVPILASERTLIVENPQRWIDISDDYPDDDEEEFDISECYQMDDGYCMLAGSEFCDWECPFDWSEDDD